MIECEKCGKKVAFKDMVKEVFEYVLTKKSMKNYNKFWCLKCKLKY